MHSLEPKKNLSNIMESAISNTAAMNKEIERLRCPVDFTEGKKLLIKIKNVIMANTGLIQSIDQYIFDVQNRKLTEFRTIRSEWIRNLRESCLVKLEPDQGDAQKHKALSVQVRAKHKEILALWKQCMAIEQLTEDLLAELDDAMILRDAIAFNLYGADDWEDELIELEKPKRKLSRSC